MFEEICSSSGSGAVIKDGGKAPRLPPRGLFVVVVVGSADNQGGGNERAWRRQRFSPLARMWTGCWCVLPVCGC